MSPRAACRLEGLGFEEVLDYVLGIADWKAADLPLEGTAAGYQQVSDATRPDIPTCEPDETVADVRSRTFGAGWDECIVLHCDGIVVGRLRGDSWNHSGATIVETAMEPGPTTVRPDGALHPLVDRMTTRGTKLVVVATPQGHFHGILLREDAERLLTGEPPEQIWVDCDGCPGRWKVQPASPASTAH